MHAELGAVDVGPDDLLVAGDLDELRAGRAGIVVAEHDVPVREPGQGGGPRQRRVGQLALPEFPDDLALGVDLHELVADGQADQRMARRVAQGAEGAVVQFRGRRLVLPDDLAGGVELADEPVLRHEVVAIRQLTRHPALEVRVLGCALQRDLDLDAAGGVDLEQARTLARLRQQRAPVGQALGGVHLGLGALVFEHHLMVARDLDDRAAGVGIRLMQGEQHVAVREDAPVAGLRGVFPDDLALGVDDLRDPAEHEEGALGRRLGGEGAEGGGEQGEELRHRYAPSGWS